MAENSEQRPAPTPSGSPGPEAPAAVEPVPSPPLAEPPPAAPPAAVPPPAQPPVPPDPNRLVIVPASVSVESDTSQRFEARRGSAVPPEVEWSISPEFGALRQAAGPFTVYASPPWVFRSRTVMLTASAGGRSATATIEVSALRFWTHFLGAYWLAWFAAIVVLIALRWTWLCPNCRTEVLISPPLVTLTPGATQHFVSNVPVTWTTPIIAPGLYIAPRSVPAEQMVNFTVASTADPKQTGSAVIVNSPDYGIAIVPAVTTVRAGDTVRLTAFPMMNPGQAQPVLEFIPLSGLEVDEARVGESGLQTATLNTNKDLTTATTITVFARTTDPVRMAGAHVVVLPVSADTTRGASSADCAGDARKLLLLVLLMGAAGGLVHGIGSFGTYVGNRQLVVTWTWWYVFKPVLGALVALVVYLVYRGGFSGTDTFASAVDCIKVGAFAGLIGLFAEPATLKLKDIFETVFTPRRDPRLDKAAAPAAGSAAGAARPSIERLDPPSLPKGTPGESIVRIIGSGFANTCEVRVGGKRKDREWVSETELRVKVDQQDLATVPVTIVVSNPEGEPSDPVTLTVT